MTIEELQAEVDSLKAIHEIQNLQARYGYQIERRRSDDWDEIIELFTDDATLEIGDSGVYVGKEGITKFWKDFFRDLCGFYPNMMSVVLQVQPYIKVYGDTAAAVWQGFGFITRPLGWPDAKPEDELSPWWLNGFYEVEYKKVNGHWKISKFHYNEVFECPYEDGWVKKPGAITMRRKGVGPDRPITEYKPYNPHAKTDEEQMRAPILPPESRER